MKLTLEGLAYRALWELDCRSGFKALRTPRGQVPLPDAVPKWPTWSARLRDGHPLLSPRPRCSHPDLPEPAVPDWHLEPATGAHWPARIHWSRARSAGGGDLRLTWERNRFAHVWRWVAEGTDAAETFRDQLRSWRYENPYRSGVNWASGQELALRSMAWLVGGAAFGGKLSAAEWHNLVELIYWHGVQIEAEFGFSARAVRNNHLLAEALALAQIADVFDCFSEASRWRKLGLETFVEAVEEQFFDDGGYCQCSHTYHHFALELVLDAHAWFPELRETLEPVLIRAERLFGALIDDGRVPNFGPNDRLDHPDFEALISALRGVVSTTEPEPAASFADAGLHVLRSDDTTATLRCGPLPDRAGHDDGLHVEVWAHGHPIALDAGSYRYGGPDHDWFAGAWSHNICMSGSSSPRELLSTFTWDRLAYPHLEEFDPDRLRMTATYDAYRDIRWERTVSLQDGVCTVEDLLDPIDADPPTLQKLHWLIDARPQDVVVESVDNYTWTISTPKAQIVLAVTAVIGQLSRTQLRTEPGWSSTTYGERTLVTSLQLSTHCPAVRFQTTFTPR